MYGECETFGKKGMMDSLGLFIRQKSRRGFVPLNMTYGLANELKRKGLLN